MSDSEKDIDLGALAAAVESYTRQVRDAEAVEDAARKETSAARNHLNEAQKALDAAIIEFHARAPWNTAWHNARHSSVSVGAPE